jgi:hypothetical protein
MPEARRRHRFVAEERALSFLSLFRRQRPVAASA